MRRTEGEELLFFFVQNSFKCFLKLVLLLLLGLQQQTVNTREYFKMDHMVLLFSQNTLDGVVERLNNWESSSSSSSSSSLNED